MNAPPSPERADAPSRARVVTRAALTSDVTRPRAMLFAATLAAVGVSLAVALVPSKHGISSPGPLQRPHVEAKLACAACHVGDGAPAAKACVGCHSAHPSTRPAHRALAVKGELACVSCHAAHGDAQGVTWLADGTTLRWGGGRDEPVPLASPASGRVPLAGITVPLVTIAACARCHDTARAADPIAACLSRAAPRIDVCFDEHQRADGVSPGGGACRAQHGASRFVAWDAAREAAARVPWVRPIDEQRLPWTWVGSGFAVGMLALASLTGLSRSRRKRAASPKPSLVAPSPATLAPPQRVRLPQIDTSTCLGCYACVDACPFDVLTIEHYVAVVAKPKDCCGVVLCQDACPNGSLRMIEGEPTPHGARLDAHLESLDAPGVFLAGDLTGLPLIKNAIRQGARVVDRIEATLARGCRVRAGDAHFDVLVIGAGPAGLSAALRAKELGLACVVVEQATMAASIKRFPRNKLVFDPPLDIPLEGELWLRESTKEELLVQWTRIVRARALRILEEHAVTGVRRKGALFAVTAATPEGERELCASRIVLAIGRRGSPRLLDAAIAPDAESRVSYALADARSFAGQRVLVIGLGDAAMEAACALARQPGTEVTISYRGADFARGKARNIDEVKALTARGRLRIVFESRVERVDVGRVRLITPRGAEDIASDCVLALIGGVPSWSLVESAGVRLAGAAHA